MILDTVNVIEYIFLKRRATEVVDNKRWLQCVFMMQSLSGVVVLESFIRYITRSL